MLPLQFIDGLLLPVHLGHVLLLGFVLTTLGALPLKSQRVIAVNTILFGVIFMMTPFTTLPQHYIFLGLALTIIGPIIYTTARS